MKLEQISVNLFTLREHLKSRDSFANTISRLAKIGFKSVQLSGVAPDLMPEKDFVRVCADHGIAITSTHEPAVKLLAEPQWSIDRLHALGVTQAVYPHFTGINLNDAGDVKRWLARLEEVGQLLRSSGITLSYHNHHNEFARLEGKTIYERVFDETTLTAEPDTYWIQFGGNSPLEWTRRLGVQGRLPLIHLKDMRVLADGPLQFAELGAGNLDLPPIIAAAGEYGCQSFIIEQDDTYGRDAFESVRESFDYLKTRFVS